MLRSAAMAEHKPVAETATFCDGVKLNEAGDAIESVIRPFTEAKVNLHGLVPNGTKVPFSAHFCVVIECPPGRHVRQMRFFNPRDEQLAITRAETVEIEPDRGGLVIVERKDLPVDMLTPGRYHLEVALDGEVVVRVPLVVSFHNTPTTH